jgi:hypothetical protein
MIIRDDKNMVIHCTSCRRSITQLEIRYNIEAPCVHMIAERVVEEYEKKEKEELMTHKVVPPRSRRPNIIGATRSIKPPSVSQSQKAFNKLLEESEIGKVRKPKFSQNKSVPSKNKIKQLSFMFKLFTYIMAIMKAIKDVAWKVIKPYCIAFYEWALCEKKEDEPGRQSGDADAS